MFRPSDVAVGPDGAIYVADWFDPRVGGHQDLDDTTRGTIYRIAPKGFKSVVPKFDLATTEGQITALKSPAINVRALGFNGLAARGPAALGPVQGLLDDGNPLRAGARRVAAHATGHRRPGARRKIAGRPGCELCGSRLTGRCGRRCRPQRHAARLARDPSAAMRREVALSQRDVPFEAARDVLLTLAQSYDGNDRSLPRSLGVLV